MAGTATWQCMATYRLARAIFTPSASAPQFLRDISVDRRSSNIEKTLKMAAKSTVAGISIQSNGELEPCAHVVDDNLVPELVLEAQIWSSLNGLVVGDRNVQHSGTVPGVGVVHAPVALLPTPFPKELFDQAIGLATVFNDITDSIGQDADFLQQTLRSAGETDPFTAGLLNIHATVLKEGISQEIRLGMHRSDYMIDVATGSLLQVELNTISSSFPGLSSLVTSMHRHLVKRFGNQIDLDTNCIPENPAGTEIAEALGLAWKEYARNEGVVLMVVQPEEYNMYDQHWLTSLLWRNHGVRLIRRTLAEIHHQGRIAFDGSLLIGEQLVSVVYYRAGYGPSDYPTSKEWEARLLIERSRAVKCPSVAYHLVGAKKIQQELARPGIIDRFLPDLGAATALKNNFAGLWGLEGEGAEEAIEQALAKPESYVLKPQREGGGNNVYGVHVRDKLLELRDQNNGKELAAYILMQRIFPPIHPKHLLRSGKWVYEDTLSELGIYSTYLRNGDKIVLNKQAGHLLRTKTASSDEGGVATGFAVLDSPYLISS